MCDPNPVAPGRDSTNAGAVRLALLTVSCLALGACTFDPRSLERDPDDLGGIPVDAGLMRIDTGVLDATPAPDALSPPRCGDGLLGADEACDDGDTEDGDGCARTCAVEPGYTCAGTTCVNPPPELADDRARIGEDQVVDLSVLSNDRDLYGDVLQLIGTSTPALGRVARVGLALRYTPAPDVFGRDMFTYRARDLAGQVRTASVVVTITPTNDAPRVQEVVARTGYEAGVQVTFSAVDPDGHSMRYLTTRPTHGTLGPVDSASASVRYTPARGYVGVDHFTYRAADAALSSRTATVTVVVLPADWRVPEAGARRPLCVDGSTLTADVADFPVAVRGSFPGAAGGGTDLVLAGPTGDRWPHEVERWSAGEGVLWARVPQVRASTTTCAYVYFGRPVGGPGPEASLVWASGFSVVVHFGQARVDSANGVALSWAGTTSVAGVYGDGRAFDGSGWIDLPPATLDSAEGSISAWLWLDPGLELSDDVLLVYGTRATIGMRQGLGRDELHLGLDADEHLRFFVWGGLDVVAPARLTTGQWRHVAVTWARAGAAVLWVDGRELSREPHEAEAFVARELVRVGGPFDPSVRRFVGGLDELRVSAVARPRAWIEAEHALAQPGRVLLGPVDDGVR